MADACRGVAGKLGAYVRGGLGARDTAQVEGHLEACGDCRALVLELRDVNHGLRAIIAPLVLGAAGLGALTFPLPTSGGLAAGSTALASGGAAAGTAGAGGVGSGATGSGAAVAGVAGSAASAGASGGVLAAIGGFFAGAPVALVAGVGGVVVVAAVAAGALLLTGGPDQPGAVGPGATATASAGDSGVGIASAGPGDTPTSAPTDLPTVSPGAPTPAPAEGALAATGSPSGSGVTRDAASSSTSATGSTGAPDSGSTGAPDSGSTSTSPTQPAVPGTAVLVVSDPSGGVALAAGQTGQELGVDVTNTGTGPATNLVARVDLPAGVDAESVTLLVGGRFAARLGTSWDCAAVATGVSCTLPVLDAGASTHVSVQVGVAEDFAGGDITWQVSATGLRDVVNHPSSVTWYPAPARLVLASPSVETPLLLRGRTTTVDVPLLDAGGVAATPATVAIAVPDGLAVTGSAGDGWTCTGTGDVTCELPSLPARATSTLVLHVLAGASAPDEESLVLTLAPGGRRASSTAELAFRGATPARLAAPSSLSSLPMAPGTPVTTTITVANTGDLDATGLAATLTRPDGATWRSVTSSTGWICPVDGAARSQVVCVLDRLAAGATSSLAVTLNPASPVRIEPGALRVALAADPDTDVAPALEVPTAVADLGRRYVGTGLLDVTEVGAPLLGCSADLSSPCWAGTVHANNNDVAMVPVDAAPAPDEVSKVSSSTTLTLPAGVSGSDVTWAGLYWSANRAPRDSWTTARGAAQLRGPGGTYQAVSATSTQEVRDSNNRTYYQSSADVTDAVRALGAGTWSVADVAVSADRTDTVRTYYGGWALVVVYDTSGAAKPAETSTVSVYDGAAWLASNSSRGVGIATGAGAAVRVGVVAWDGDRGTTGDRLRLDGTRLTPWRPTGWGSSGNAFDSTAAGWGYGETFGVDAKGFCVVEATGPTSALTASTSGDQYLLGVVTARVTR
jgi:anti-sigma factor RsiW